LVILVAVIIASMSIDALAASEDPVPPRLIYGEVQFDGNITLGNGFSVDHIDDGYYKFPIFRFFAFAWKDEIPRIKLHSTAMTSPDENESLSK
jgi:hypothetical protein